MSDLMVGAYRALLWVLFFATTVYGHVGMKLAVSGESKTGVLRALLGFWGISSIAAWSISGLLWAFILAKEPLFAANSISSLRYLFICLAAWLFLNEAIGKTELVGMSAIAFGVWILSRS